VIIFLVFGAIWSTFADSAGLLELSKTHETGSRADKTADKNRDGDWDAHAQIYIGRWVLGSLRAAETLRPDFIGVASGSEE
jgi:hypothetical protein